MEFSEVTVFDLNAKRYESKNLQQVCRINEMEKKRKYNENILQVEKGSFSILVFSS